MLVAAPVLAFFLFFFATIGFRSFWMLILLVILALVRLIITSGLHYIIALVVVESTWLLLLLWRRNIEGLTPRRSIVVVHTLILLAHQLVGEASLVVDVARA